MEFTVTVKTDARAFLIEIIGVDTTDISFCLKSAIEAVTVDVTDNNLDMILANVNVTVSVTLTLRVYPDVLINETAFEIDAVMVFVIALIMVLLPVILIVNEIK